MSQSLAPHRLSLLQRLQLWTWRCFAALLSWLARLRRVAAPRPVERHRYGDHPAESLEYLPPADGVTPRTPVVYVHGGGWIIGRKELYTPDLVFLAEAGHPVYNLEYPLAPETPHPGILRSLLRALRWVNARDPEVTAVHLMGDSAGGNLVSMLGLLCANPELLASLESDGRSDPPLEVRSVVSLYGVLDRLSWIEHRFPGARLMLHCYAGPSAFAAEVGPELSITPLDLDFRSTPPVFVAAASEDPLCESSKLAVDHLRARSGEVHDKLYEGESHGFFNLRWRPVYRTVRADILEFLAKH